VSVAGSAGCASCGGLQALHLGAEGPLCDRCFDDRIVAGTEFEEFGDHDADPKMLLDLVTVRADTEMARRILTRTDSGRWEICHDEGRLADEVVGRIETVGPFGPLTLVVDGHAISWDELGQVLSPYEGWQFVLRITDRFGDPRL